MTHKTIMCNLVSLGEEDPHQFLLSKKAFQVSEALNLDLSLVLNRPTKLFPTFLSCFWHCSSLFIFYVLAELAIEIMVNITLQKTLIKEQAFIFLKIKRGNSHIILMVQ